MSDIHAGDSIDLSSLANKLQELSEFKEFITNGVYAYYAREYQGSADDFVNSSARELYDDLYSQQLAGSNRSSREKEIIRDLLRFLTHGEDRVEHPEYLEYYKCLLQKKIIKFYIQEYKKLRLDAQRGKIKLSGGEGNTFRDLNSRYRLKRIQCQAKLDELRATLREKKDGAGASAAAAPNKSKKGGRKRKPIKINPKMKGVFTKKAKRKGMSVQKYASYVIKKYKGKTKNKKQLKLLRQAVFAKTAKKWKKRGRKSKSKKK